MRLVRAHLEEDAGKSLHEDFIGQTGIDLNRAGTPLLEIVTEPDMRSSAEAVAYAKELHKIVTWIGICDGNMQEGSFRCDANVSVRKPGEPLGTRREIKNLNSFKFMQQAIDYEVRWQIEQIEDGHAIEQATVLFNPDTGETRAMRTKEDAADYRYFPDPDLPPLVIAEEWVQQVRSAMTELPRVMAQRFVTDYGLSEYDANALTQSRTWRLTLRRLPGIVDSPSWRATGSWARSQAPDQPAGGRTSATFRSRFQPLWGSCFGALPMAISTTRPRRQQPSPNCASGVDRGSSMTLAALIDADHRGQRACRQMNDTGELEKIVDDVLAANPKNVDEYKAGNSKALNALVGQIMKGSKGKANPQQVNDLLRKKLG